MPRSVGAAPRSAVRTFLFADLRDYTAFAETRGDAAARDLLRAFRKIVRAEVGAREGREIKTEGDNVYVVFELPGDAIKCAMGIQRRALRHNDRDPELALRIGIGINCGEAVSHDTGYVSAAVVVAARLSSQAAAGTILVTDTVRGLIRTTALAPMRELGAWTLKGISQPVRVFQVETAPRSPRAPLAPAMGLPALLVPAPSSGAAGLVMCPTLVGRTAALGALWEHVSAASIGERRFVAVAGEAGVGKSRLAREVAARAHREGLYIFGGRAHPGGAAYEAFVAALRPYARARGGEVLRRLLGPLMPELRRLLPELAGDTQEGPLPDEERRERFLRTIQLLIEDAAAQRPVLLVLEDFHEADASARDLLLYLATNLRAGVCIVLTYRADEVDGRHPLSALLAHLERSRLLVTVSLAPLDRQGVTEMTRALVGAAASDDLVAAVYARSEGIPFYVEELLKTALDARTATSGEHDATSDLSLPRSISDSVRMRVDRLSAVRGDGSVELLELAATAGVPLSYETILAIDGRPEREVSADIAAAVDAQLLERPATRTEIYQFRHALTREAIASAITTGRRRRHHLRVAEALEKLGPAAGRSAFLGQQFAAAGARERAVSHLLAAATEAEVVGAYRASIDLLERSRELATSEAERFEAAKRLAQAYLATGEAAEAERILKDARRVAEPQAVALVDLLLARSLRMQGRRREAVLVVTRATAALEGAPTSALAEAAVLHAELRWAENDPSGAIAQAERALDIARACGATRVVVLALTVLGSARTRQQPDVGPSALREAVQLAMANDLIAEAVNAYYELGRAEIFRSEAEAATVAAETGLALAREHGLEFAQARLLSLLTGVAMNLGRYAEARGYAEQAIASARADTIASIDARVALGFALANQGEYERALSIFDELAPRRELADPDRQMTLQAYRTQALVGLGRLAEARSAADAAVRIATENPGMGMVAFLNAADMLEATRDLSGAENLIATFDRYFAGRSTAAIRATRLEFEAIIALLGSGDAAAAFDAVVAAWLELGAMARAAYRRGSAALARIRVVSLRPAARKDLGQARNELVRRQALRYVDILDQATRRPRRRPTSRSPFILTERELRVATLLARGYTDERIAKELGTSPDRAAEDVTGLLQKLGVPSRSQVAAWVVEREAASAGGTAAAH